MTIGEVGDKVHQETKCCQIRSEARCVSKHTTGVVRWFDGSKGYGYIDAESGEDVFVHHTALIGQEAPLLSEGERVAFFLEYTVRGPQATDVTRLN